MAESKRLDWLDILKGVGILLIVVGHLSVGALAKSFLYSFHVPLFLFASGLVYKKRSTVSEFLKKDFWRILRAYLFFAVIWIVFSALWARQAPTGAFLLNALLSLVGGNGNLTGVDIGVQWYLAMYLAIRVMYALLDLIPWRALRWAILAALFVVGAVLLNGNAALPWCLSSALTGLLFFGVGAEFRQAWIGAAETYARLPWWRRSIPLVAFGALAAVAWLFRWDNSMSKNAYDLPWVFPLLALIGFVGAVTLSVDLSRIPLLNRALICCGVNSLFIMGWHSELRVALLDLFGRVITDGLIKNALVLFASLVLLVPLCWLTSRLLRGKRGS